MMLQAYLYDGMDKLYLIIKWGNIFAKKWLQKNEVKTNKIL